MSGADPRPVSSRKPKRVSQAERDARLRFKQAVFALDRGCIAHDDEADCEPPLQSHHVITRQRLRQAGLDEWAVEAGACVCYRAHRRHHSRMEPLPLSRLPTRCVRFAVEHGLTDYLHRFYS